MTLQRTALVGYAAATVLCAAMTGWLSGAPSLAAAAALGACLVGGLDAWLRAAPTRPLDPSAAIVAAWFGCIAVAQLLSGGIAEGLHWREHTDATSPLAATLASIASWTGLGVMLAATLPALRRRPTLLVTASGVAVVVAWTALDGALFPLWAPDGELLWATVDAGARQPIVLAEVARGGVAAVRWLGLGLAVAGLGIAAVGSGRPGVARMATMGLAAAWIVGIGLAFGTSTGLDGAALADAVHDALAAPGATAAPAAWPDGVTQASWGWSSVVVVAGLALPALALAVAGRREPDPDDAGSIGWTWIGMALAVAGEAALQDQTLTSQASSLFVPLVLVVGALQAAAAMAKRGGSTLRVVAACSAWFGVFLLLLTGVR